jgi:hypothetical protein
MSEELCAIKQQFRVADVETPSSTSPAVWRQLPSPVNARDTPAANLASPPSSSASGSRSRGIAGGGSALAPGDKPGDPFATLIVIAGDCLVGQQPFNRLTALPPMVDKALQTSMSLIEGTRCVIVCAGGPHLTQAMMEACVSRVPGGLDSFGPGRRVEACFKERSAAFGNLWESALLVKSLAKRQAALIRFGTVRVVTGERHITPTLRCYRHCFGDWRVLVNGGACHGGRDEPIDVQVVPIPVEPADAKLESRAAAMDDNWFERGLLDYAQHPAWPQNRIAAEQAISATSPQKQKAAAAGADRKDEPALKRSKVEGA